MTTTDFSKLNKFDKVMMAHRYLYYLRMTPVITDIEFSKIDLIFCKAALYSEYSPMYGVASESEEDYNDEIKEIARMMLRKEKEIFN